MLLFTRNIERKDELSIRKILTDELPEQFELENAKEKFPSLTDELNKIPYCYICENTQAKFDMFLQSTDITKYDGIYDFWQKKDGDYQFYDEHIIFCDTPKAIGSTGIYTTLAYIETGDNDFDQLFGIMFCTIDKDHNLIDSFFDINSTYSEADIISIDNFKGVDIVVVSSVYDYSEYKAIYFVKFDNGAPQICFLGGNADDGEMFDYKSLTDDGDWIIVNGEQYDTYPDNNPPNEGRVRKYYNKKSGKIFDKKE